MKEILDTKLKFYFSLMFISKKDFIELINNLDENLNVTNSALINNILNVVEKIEENINLKDNVISRIFDVDFLMNQKDLYLKSGKNLDLEDEEDIYEFLCYAMLNKVKEKKDIYKSTLYDFFKPYTKKEVNKAIANLNGYEIEQLTMYFGINYDRLVEINSNDITKNILLIKIYYYLLNNSDENDVNVLFKLYDENIKEEYNLYDYIRFLYNDKKLTDEQIVKIINKLDYDTKLNLKLTFGKDYKDKKKVNLSKNVKKSISKLTSEIKKEKVIDIKKSKLKKEEIKKENKRKKSKGVEEPKKENKEKQKEEKKKKEEPKKENKEKQKEEKKKEEPKSKKEKQQKNKKEEKNQEKPKTEKKNEENKKLRLDKFLSEYNLEKKDFLIAVSMLSPLNKIVVELYYGLKEDPIDIEEIAKKISRDIDATWTLLEDAKEKIVDLIKTGAINKKKNQKQEKEKLNEKNKLKVYISEKQVKNEDLLIAINSLSGVSSVMVNMYLGLNTKQRSINEIAHDLKYDQKEVDKIINEATPFVILELSKLEEIKKEQKEDDKKQKIIKQKEEKKQEEKKEPEKEIDEKYLVTGSLSEFLKNNGITKQEFSYGYKSLDSLSKRIISLYFSSYSINDIAKEYDMEYESVLKIITSAQDKIIKKISELNKEKSNMTLTKYLNDNNISLINFKKHFNSLTSLQQNVLTMYLGLNGKSLTEKEIADKLYRSENSIKVIIKDSTSRLKELSNKKEEKTKSKLELFLKENNITSQQLNEALKKLDPINASVMQLYFKNKQVGEIASKVGINRIQVINIISSSKKEIIEKIKTPKSKETDKKDNNNELFSKVKNITKLLIIYPELEMIIKSNPIAFQGISALLKYDLSIEELANILNVPTQILKASISNVLVDCETYIANIKNKSNSAFKDEGMSKEKDKAK